MSKDNINTSETTESNIQESASTQASPEQIQPTTKKASSPKSKSAKAKSTTPKVKELTLTQNKKVASQLNKMEEYELESVEAVVKFYPEFSYDRIEQLLKELTNSLKFIGENEIEIDEDTYMNYIFFLTIKHFTHLKKTIADEFDKQLVQMNELIATGVYKEIMDNVFQPKEIKKVLDSLGDIIGNTMFMQDVEARAQDKLSQLELQNKDMLNVFSKEALANKLN